MARELNFRETDGISAGELNEEEIFGTFLEEEEHLAPDPLRRFVRVEDIPDPSSPMANLVYGGAFSSQCPEQLDDGGSESAEDEESPDNF